MMPVREYGYFFPQQMTPFIVGREAAAALEEALAGDKKIFLSTQQTLR